MAKRHVRCPKCCSLATKRNGTRRTNAGQIRRFICLGCRYSFSLRHQPGKGLSHREKVSLTRGHLEGRTSMRVLARHNGHSKTTICRAIHEVTRECVSAAWIAQELKPQWGGYLALDGKMIRVWDWAAKHFRYTKEQKRWLHKMSLLIALDLETLDIPNHHLGDEETTFDLVLMLRELKEMGYPLKGYVSDGNEDIPKAVELVFGRNIPHQLCIRHYLQNLKIRLREGKVTELQYREAVPALLSGARPKLLPVPEDLFTYRNITSLPSTNQQLENLIRYLNLRLKTINIFHDWTKARDYLNALILMRRFTEFTDCHNPAKNHHAPLELAFVDISKLDYLNLKSNR